MTTTICTACGGNLALIGRVHRCIPRHVTVPDPMLPLPTPHLANVIHVANSMMANEPTRALGLNRSSPTYRYRNPTKRRAYMADYMRAYRKRATVRPASAP